MNIADKVDTAGEEANIFSNFNEDKFAKKTVFPCSHQNVSTQVFPCSRKKQWEHFFLRVPTKKTWEHFVNGVRMRCSHVPTYLFRYFVPKRRGNMFPKSRKMFPLRWRQDAMFPLFPLFPRKNTTLKEKKMTHGEREKKKKKNALRAIYKKKMRTLGTHFVFSL